MSSPLSGLLGYLGRHPGNLFVVDIVCHAIVCRAVFSAYVDWLDRKVGAEGDDVRFRDKERFGYLYSMMRALSSGGDSASVELYRAGVESDPYLRAFFSDVCDRPSCYSYAFKKRYRESDVTIWDFFDVCRMDRSFDDNRGVTRVLCHTDAGTAHVSVWQRTPA